MVAEHRLKRLPAVGQAARGRVLGVTPVEGMTTELCLRLSWPCVRGRFFNAALQTHIPSCLSCGRHLQMTPLVHVFVKKPSLSLGYESCSALEACAGEGLNVPRGSHIVEQGGP